MSTYATRFIPCRRRSISIATPQSLKTQKPAAWPRTLEARGVTVTEDVDREAATAVLQAYAAQQKPLY